MADQQESPLQTSSDYDAQASYWAMVNAILCGAEAMRATTASHGLIPGPATPVARLSQLNAKNNGSAQSPYLPRFPNETPADYAIRRANAPFTNIYGEISANLASKPFAKECQLTQDAPDQFKALSEDIDGRGNNLHVFAREMFKTGLDKSIDWVLVDYTRVPPGATLADERAMGARPYWVSIPAERMLAVYSDFVGGKEVFVHARIYEPRTVRTGYGEEQVDYVRVLNREPLFDPEISDKVTGYAPATWELWKAVLKKGEGGKPDEISWVLADSGAITIGVIPLVPFMTGRRKGKAWLVEPPLRDLAFMQVEEFQQESNLKTIKEWTAFPMLAGNGVVPPKDTAGNNVVVPVGPRSVLFAPPSGDGQHGEWTFIEPTAASLTFLETSLEKLRTEMRNLGMQPLATANLTVVTTANVAMKANSAVQAWALGLKDALEQAFKITAMWLNQPDGPEVDVFTDFAIDMEAGTELAEISKATWLSDFDKFEEFKRRGVLRDGADWDENQQALAEQQQGLAGEGAIDPITGQPVNMPAQPAAQ